MFNKMTYSHQRPQRKTPSLKATSHLPMFSKICPSIEHSICYFNIILREWYVMYSIFPRYMGSLHKEEVIYMVRKNKVGTSRERWTMPHLIEEGPSRAVSWSRKKQTCHMMCNITSSVPREDFPYLNGCTRKNEITWPVQSKLIGWPQYNGISKEVSGCFDELIPRRRSHIDLDSFIHQGFLQIRQENWETLCHILWESKVVNRTPSPWQSWMHFRQQMSPAGAVSTSYQLCLYLV